MKKIVLPLVAGIFTAIFGYGAFVLAVESPLYDWAYDWFFHTEVLWATLYALWAFGAALLCEKLVTQRTSAAVKSFYPLFFAGIAVALLVTGAPMIIYNGEFFPINGDFALRLLVYWYVSLFVWIDAAIYLILFRWVVSFINSARQKKGKSALSPGRKVAWLISVPYFVVEFAVWLEVL